MKKLILVCLAGLLGTTASAQKWGDFTLYSTQNSTTAVLLDTMSTPGTFHTWTFASTAKTGYSTYMLPGGYLLRTVAKSGNSFTGGPICGQVQKVDWNGNVVWDYVYSTTNYCTHHDIEPMPNGNVLLIAYERKTAAEVTAAGGSSAIEMWPDKIVEVQPTGPTTGTVVWEWHAWDHLMQNVDASKANYVTSISAHPELLNINYAQQKDWLHMNGVSYNEQLNQIAFSCHNMSEIYVIDHSTTTAQAASHSGGNSGKGGDILYRWGNPQAYSAGTSANQVLKVTHDAHWIPQGCPRAGYLVAFNNGGQSNPQKSCVDMINPPVNGYTYSLIGTAYSPSTYDRRHVGNGYTSNMGGSQQLPNGNMLVTIAFSGLIYEVDSNNNILWSKAVSGGAVAKAYRYSACYIAGATPPVPTITRVVDTLYSSAAYNNKWYFNGTLIPGATGQSYVATQNGTYQVKTVDSFTCASDLSDPFNFTLTGLNTFSVEYKTIAYPNPTNGLIYLENNFAGKHFNVTVFDNIGRVVKTQQDNTTIDLKNLPNGHYQLSVQIDQKTYNQKINLIQ